MFTSNPYRLTALAGPEWVAAPRRKVGVRGAQERGQLLRMVHAGHLGKLADKLSTLPSWVPTLAWRGAAGGIIALFISLGGWLSVLPAAGVESPPAKEHQIKAAFVYNFAKFVEWPAGSFAGTKSPLVIGVVGRSPISPALEAAVKERLINGRPILIKNVETAEAARATHLLFVAASEDKRVGDLLHVLAGASVLTVGESEAFGRDGGMINFVLEGDKCRFDINMDPAEQARLKVSAQLQKLAKTVRRKPSS